MFDFHVSQPSEAIALRAIAIGY